jgi:signal transduction histidine kinase/DNA-binding NarL/FixJ family response regulator
MSSSVSNSSQVECTKPTLRSLQCAATLLQNTDAKQDNYASIGDAWHALIETPGIQLCVQERGTTPTVLLATGSAGMHSWFPEVSLGSTEATGSFQVCNDHTVSDELRSLMHENETGALWVIPLPQVERAHVCVMVERTSERGPTEDEMSALVILARLTGQQLALREWREQSRSALENSHKQQMEFLARVSYEVRTPLHGILGFTELCLQEQVSAAVSEHLTNVRRSAERLQGLLDDMAELSRLDAGEVVFDHSSFSLHDVLQTLVTEFAEDASNKGISISCEQENSSHPIVFGDRVHVRQVLRYLVSNAVKFTTRGGVFLNVTTTAEASMARVRFEVTDTGPGVAPEDAERIFRAYEQGRSFRIRSHGGVGLGLALAQRLAGRMDARMSVESVLGRGSTFALEMDCLVDDSVQVDVRTKRSSVPAMFALPLHVLLAEDNHVSQTLAVAMLQREGHIVDVVSNGRAAVEAVRDGDYDLILMDVQMPEMDGCEATMRIRALDAAHGERTPIIALTAHRLHEERQRCLAAGMDDFVGKPIDWNALRRSINRWCRNAHRSGAYGSADPVVTVDAASLCARVAGRKDVLQRILAVYEEQQPKQLGALREAAIHGRLTDVRQLSHRMIGTLGCFSAVHAMASAREIEQCAAEGDLDGVVTRLAAFEDELVALLPVLKMYVEHGFDVGVQMLSEGRG